VNKSGAILRPAMLSTQDSRNGIDHALLDVVRDNLGLEEVLLPGCVN